MHAKSTSKMVLLSEFTVSIATLAIFVVYWLQLYQDALSYMFPRNCRNHAVIVLVATLTVYMATRMLLEGESPQSVIPGFLVIIFVMGNILATGKYYMEEWIIRCVTIVTTSVVFFTFTTFKGFKFLAERAQEYPLERELQWNHVMFLNFSSWRWFASVVVASIPVFKVRWGAITMGVKIVLLWVVFVGTGGAVAPSPWGALDEILLERNSLLYVILSVITFAVVMDQIAAYVAASVEAKGKAEMVDWEQIKGHYSEVLGKYRSNNTVHNRGSAVIEGASYGSKLVAAIYEGGEHGVSTRSQIQDGIQMLK